MNAKARRQHGVLNLAQLASIGITQGQLRGLRDRGRLIPVLPRVLRLDSAPMTKRLRCMAAVLWAGEGAAIAGRTSAELHGLLDPIAGPISVVGPVSRTSCPGIDLHKSKLFPLDRAVVDGIPVLTALRTLLDLAAADGQAICEIAMDAGLREGLVTIEGLRSLIERASTGRMRGTATLRRLAEVRGDEDALSGSELESRVIRLLRRARYRLPERQVHFELDGRSARVDFLYPDANLVIEVDGRKWHAGRRRETRDRRRDHTLLLQGKLVLRFTWEDVVGNGDYFLAVVGEALGLRPAR